jgi:hypothetical protein
MPFFGRTPCDLQIPYKVDPNPWKQHQNWLAIERWATYLVRNCLAAAGGARPYATRVVAAANSIATDAANADYICAGTGTDDVTIQAALDDLDSVGGTVVLLEGSYYCASGPDAFTPSIQIEVNQILRGQGSINTFIYFSDGTKRGLDNGGELRDLTVSTGEPGGGGGE